MGKYIIAGNWKMNKLPSETYDYIKEVIEATKVQSVKLFAVHRSYAYHRLLRPLRFTR